MYRFLIGIFCTGLLSGLTAQPTRSYPEVEALTYRLYQAGQWDSLLTEGRAALAAGYDFYYLYLRLGIAAFEQGAYCAAEGYLRAALRKNQGSALAQDYLYGTYLRQGQYGAAATLYRQAPSLQAQYPPPGRRPLDYLHLEGGLKPSSDPRLAGTMQYAQVGLGHQLGGRVQVYQAYSHMTQAGSWGRYTQQQYYLGGSLYLGGGWTLQPGIQYVGLTGTLDGEGLPVVSEETQRLVFPPPQPRVRYDTTRLTVTQLATGSFADQGGIAYLGLGRRRGRWDVRLYGTAYLNRHQERSTGEVHYHWEYISDNQPGPDFYQARDSVARLAVDQDSAYLQAQGGLSLTYTPATPREQLRLGLDIHLPWRDGRPWPSVSPRLTWQATSRLSWQATYYYGQVAQVIEQQGLVIHNTPDIMRHRGLLMGRFALAPQVQLSVIYLLEQRTAALGGASYRLHGLFTGLTFIL